VLSDRRLLGVCLSNASRSNLSLLNNDAIVQSLVRNNDELRQRCMGRISTIIFDHSFHQNNAHFSAFADPIAMESLCGVVSCNAISSGPEAARHLVSDWIVPSVESLPPLAVVAVMNYIAIESMSKSCPVGTHDMIKKLVQPTFQCTLGPILIESLPENDQHRTTALALKAIDAWCNANTIGFVKLRSILSSVLEAIANALYSNSNIIIDAVSDLIETLLTHDANEASLSLGMSIAGSLMSNLQLAQQVTSENESSRIQILSELVSAVGLQRFRFQERQQEGDTDVCRCLTRTASKVLIESQDLVSNKTLQSSTAGVLDLLFKAVSHPSVYVCSIAVEGLSVVVSKDQDLATRLLPHLQQKAIIPIHLVSDDGGLDDYMNFRERVLDNGLIACFTGAPSFYLQSCGAAIDEFCKHQANSQQLSFQLEAALYCMIAVSVKASKDKQVLCPQLEKMISLLTSSSISTSTPIVLARTCQFIGKYSKTLSQTKVFEQASTFVVTLFNEQNIAQLATDIDTTHASPLTEACIALKQLLFNSPQQFTTSEARQALEDIWLLPYRQQQVKFTIQDREMLCRGLIAVIITIPNDQWLGSMETLARPVLTCLDDVIKETDSARSAGQDTAPMISRLSIEIGVLAVMIKWFLKANVTKGLSGDDKARSITCQCNAMISVLHAAWACLKHVSEQYSTNEEIATSLCQLLYNSLLLYMSEDDIPLLQEITGLVKTILGVAVKTKDPNMFIPVLTVVQRFIELHGSKIEPNQNSTASNEAIQDMVKDLMLMSYDGVRDTASQDLVSPMFELLSACATKAPLFLLLLSRDSQQAGEVVCASIETALAALNSNETDITLSSILFLKKLVRYICMDVYVMLILVVLLILFLFSCVRFRQWYHYLSRV